MRVLIVGSGQVGRALAVDLLHAGHDVRVLDASSEELRRLPHDFEGRTIHGSPLDRDVLSGAVDGCDAAACVTADDNVNAVVALAARRVLRVPMALAVVGNPRRAEALRGLGAHVECPTSDTAQRLHNVLTRSRVEPELTLGGQACMYRIEVPARLAGRALSELEQPGQLVAVAVERDAHVHLAAADLRLELGDVLHVAAVAGDLVSDLERP